MAGHISCDLHPLVVFVVNKDVSPVRSIPGDLNRDRVLAQAIFRNSDRAHPHALFSRQVTDIVLIVVLNGFIEFANVLGPTRLPSGYGVGAGQSRSRWIRRYSPTAAR